MIEGRAPAAPRGITWLAVVAVGALMIAYFEALQEIARAMAGGFGSPASVVCLAVAATTVGSLPLLALMQVQLRLSCLWMGGGGGVAALWPDSVVGANMSWTRALRSQPAQGCSPTISP